MKRRIGSLLLLCLLCACLCTQVLAVSPQSCAEELSAIDVFRGTDTGFELDRAPEAQRGRRHARAPVRRGGGSALAL